MGEVQREMIYDLVEAMRHLLEERVKRYDALIVRLLVRQFKEEAEKDDDVAFLITVTGMALTSAAAVVKAEFGTVRREI